MAPIDFTAVQPMHKRFLVVSSVHRKLTKQACDVKEAEDEMQLTQLEDWKNLLNRVFRYSCLKCDTSAAPGPYLQEIIIET